MPEKHRDFAASGRRDPVTENKTVRSKENHHAGSLTLSRPGKRNGNDLVAYQLAQVNIARLRAPLDSPELIDFVSALDPVNASADLAPGFVWRLQTEDGDATGVRAFEWDTAGSAGIIVNLSVWRSIEELAAWVYGGLHRAVLRRRGEWFRRITEATVALWWVPAGHVPTTDEAEERVRHLRLHGPTPFAFTFRKTFDPPDSDAAAVSRPGSDDWLCPV